MRDRRRIQLELIISSPGTHEAGIFLFLAIFKVNPRIIILTITVL